MPNSIDEVNRILDEMTQYGIVEPIDEPDCHPLDWAEAIGIEEEVFGQIYPYAEDCA